MEMDIQRLNNRGDLNSNLSRSWFLLIHEMLLKLDWCYLVLWQCVYSPYLTSPYIYDWLYSLLHVGAWTQQVNVTLFGAPIHTLRFSQVSVLPNDSRLTYDGLISFRILQCVNCFFVTRDVAREFRLHDGL